MLFCLALQYPQKSTSCVTYTPLASFHTNTLLVSEAFLLPPRAWHSKTSSKSVPWQPSSGHQPSSYRAKDIGTQATEASPGLLELLDPAPRPAFLLPLGAETLPLDLHAAAAHGCLWPKNAMGGCWLGLVFALAVAAPSYMGGDTPDREATAAHTWAPCLQEESTAAPEEERRLTPRFSSCMLHCAAQAMLRMVSTKSALSLKLNEGSQGEEHEFCWMLRLRCQKGERLTKAFVLLNLEQPPDGGQLPPYRLLLTTPPSLRQHLQPRHRSRATKLVSEEACGVRYDVTEPFRSAGGGRDAQMCIKAVCPEEDVCGALRLGLQCPPFLATLWRSLPRPDD
ncbi:uncharacterized protein LOC121915690 [Sceloporus undulatus]|uniref:uncharacterized protein LOC121915690 n=1 Tax=Sceloporus undulatus TaxID=8520 RepID=UPI001C4B5C71|nr:uncharacterized protein LOC121915690 [Sceloporus undulatus]